MAPLAAADGPTTRPSSTASAPASLSHAAAAKAREKIDAFVAHVRSDPAAKDAAKKVIADAWQGRRTEEDPRGFLEEALAVVSPGYRKALDAMGEQKYADAEKLLVPLTASPDPYIAIHSAAVLARALIEQDKIDDAIKLLDAWRDRDEDVARYSFQGPEMDFMRAYGLLKTLKYERAAAALDRFMQDYPDAPDRLRLTARQILQELQQREPQGLGDIADLMGYAGRQLRLGLSDQPVVEAQDQSVELLTRLIKKSEEDEQQGQGGGGGRSGGKGRSGAARGTQPPNAPAERSTLPDGRAENGPTHHSPTARPGEMWGQMPARQREQILQSLRKNFPERYRELVEQYYKQLGKQE